MKNYLRKCFSLLLLLTFICFGNLLAQNNRISTIYSVNSADARGCTATADAGADFSICSGGIAGLSGSFAGAASSAEWKGGMGSFDPNRFDPQADYYPDPSEFGTILTLWLVTDDPVGTCLPDSDDVVLNIILSPALHPIAPVTFCSPDTSYDLNNLVVLDSNNVTGFLTFFDNMVPPMPLPNSIVSPPVGVPTVYNVFKVTNTTPSCFSIQPVTVTRGELTTSSASTDETCSGICDGTANISVTVGTSPYTYSWSNGSSMSNLSGLCAGSYIYTITDASGCSNSDTITINAGQLSTTNVSITNVSCTGFCDGMASATTTGGTPPFSYLWSNGATGASVNNLCAGTYQLTCTDSNGCSNTQTVTITEPANNLPLANFTYNNVTGTVTFTNTSTNATTYSWNFGDGSPLNNMMNPVHTYSTGGNFNVVLTVTGPCGSNDTTIVVPVVTGIDENINSYGITISPNPASSQIEIDMTDASLFIQEITISDILGRTVYSSVLNNRQNKLIISLVEFENGNYFIHLIAANKNIVHKILIRK